VRSGEKRLEKGQPGYRRAGQRAPVPGTCDVSGFILPKKEAWWPCSGEGLLPGKVGQIAAESWSKSRHSSLKD
jgi:hypothetical protein